MAHGPCPSFNGTNGFKYSFFNQIIDNGRVHQVIFEKQTVLQPEKGAF